MPVSALLPLRPRSRVLRLLHRVSRPRLAKPALAGALFLFIGSHILGADLASAPVGYVNVPLLRASDTIVAVPLVSQIEYSGQIAAVTPASAGRFEVTLSRPPGFTADQFKTFYYLRVETGSRRGAYFTIAGNSSTTLTLESDGYDYTALAPGDAVCIRRYWTLGTLFPVSAAETPSNPLSPSVGTLAARRRSQIILFDNTFEGINLPAGGIYFFTVDGWYQATAGNPRADDVILHPDSSFIIRQPATVTADTTWSVAGSVVEGDERIALFTSPAGPQDNAVAFNRPFDIKLSASGLESAFVASPSTFASDRRDQLLVFDNSIRSFNKTPVAIYYRVGHDWIKAVEGNPVANDDVLRATAGIVVRKYVNALGTPAEWLNQNAQ